jgi:glucose-1-phosphate thymidylyltransferase
VTTVRATTAVLLARGLGTRMRHHDPSATLSADQRAVAGRGLKAMIPDRAGRPFMSHILAGLADAGVERVVLIVAPDHAEIRDYYAAHPPRRVRLDFAVQDAPRGTADAVVAAADLVGRDPFLILNADNLYPRVAVESLVGLGEPGVVGFDPARLATEGTITPERLRAFALLEVGADGYLRALVEKPDADRFVAMAGAPVSMNLWRANEALLDACRRVGPSSRGEYELPEAVAAAIDDGLRVRVVSVSAPVLDLSHPADVAPVTDALADRDADP